MEENPAKKTKQSAKHRRKRSSTKASALKRAFRLNNRWKKLTALQASLADSLEKIGRGKMAFDIRQCHTSFRGSQCNRCHGSWATATFSCGVRLCPFEMRKRSMRALHRFREVIASLRDPRYMVLSMRNCALQELRAGIQTLFASLERLRHSALWKATVTGALVTLEVTFNEAFQTWHPHLNIVFEGSYIPQAELARAWRKAARDEGLIVPYIERANRGTAFELIKYITKLADFVHIPEAVGAFLDGTKRTRFLRTYGSLYGLNLAEDDDGAGNEVPTCPDCRSKDVLVLRKCFLRDDVYYDGAGVLRICLPVEARAVRSYDG